MKSKLFFIAFILLSNLVKAQTEDTVEAKIRSLPYRNFEIPPRFPNMGIYQYIYKNIHLSQDLQTYKKGLAVVALFIDTNGNATGLQLLKTINPEIDKEILRILGSLPRFKPAMYNSQKVNLNLVMEVGIRTDKNNVNQIYASFYNNIALTSDTEDPVFQAVEITPSFPGGSEAFLNYISQHAVYSPNARRNNVQGTVIITLIIEKDGSLTNLEVLRSADDELSIEALRLLHSSPKWNPAMQNGKAVRVQYTIPIKFSLK